MRAKNPEISWEEARIAFSYRPETGEIIHRKDHKSVRAGSRAGNLQPDGYIRIKFKGYKILAHRLAWFLYFGKWPDETIDHVNRNKSDNRLANLRPATYEQNNNNRSFPRNNTSGAVGVEQVRSSGRWRATIFSKGARKIIGFYDTKEEAVAARLVEEQLKAVEMARGKE